MTVAPPQTRVSAFSYLSQHLSQAAGKIIRGDAYGPDSLTRLQEQFPIIGKLDLFSEEAVQELQKSKASGNYYLKDKICCI